MTQLFNGLAYGVLLLVLASGLAMIYGLRDVINFAHGALYMLGAYIASTIAVTVNFWAALIAAPLVLAAIGVLLDRFGLRYLSRRTALEVVLVTFGLTFIIQDTVTAVWGPDGRSVKAPAGLDGSAHLLGVTYPTYRLFLIVVGLAVGIALMLWLRYSRTGMYVRASSEDREITAMMGVNVDRASALVVGLGAGLAGLAGALAGPYLTLSLDMGTSILVTSFIVVVLGGLGSIGGAMVAALLIGFVQTLGQTYFATYAELAPFAAMILILLIRPRGLAGRNA